MVKVKRTVEKDFPDLIKWAWENNIHGKSFNSKKIMNALHFDSSGCVQTHCNIDKNDVFIINIEEEITEDTILPEVVEIFANDTGAKWFEDSINNLKDAYSKEFWIKDGNTMTLIWKDGELV